MHTANEVCKAVLNLLSWDDSIGPSIIEHPQSKGSAQRVYFNRFFTVSSNSRQMKDCHGNIHQSDSW